MHSAIAVANYFIRKAQQEEQPITLLQLLKLTYIAHGWHLAVLNRALFEERVKAWQYGPVIPAVYHEFKRYGSGPISQVGMITDAWSGARTVPDEQLEPDTRDVLDRVWIAYRHFTAAQLVHITHQDDSPWKQCYEGPTESPTIPEGLIKSHFQNKASANQAAEAVSP
ncbi:MAG: type II toxin-antitoxin system antitoxin SocA domain-containing protein [Planctomycetota bacterium]